MVGALDLNTTSKFTGYINAIQYSLEPQSTVEMLSNSNRSPIENSWIFEPNTANFIIAKDMNSSYSNNKFYDYGFYFKEYEVDMNISTIKIEELKNSQIEMCYSFIKVRF